MYAERWAQIDCLFDQVLERPPETRIAFLATACEGDDELRREIEALLEAHSDTNSVIRFELEARAASALNHPNIITIYDIGEMAGTYYMAAEYVEGQTLRQLIHQYQGRNLDHRSR